MVEVVGRGEGLGRPLLYGTTARFLEHFGFAALEDLPRPEELPVVLRDRTPLGLEDDDEDDTQLSLEAGTSGSEAGTSESEEATSGSEEEAPGDPVEEPGPDVEEADEEFSGREETGNRNEGV